MSKVLHEGWMVRYGRRKIGKSFIHTRYFVLDSQQLSYYKKKPADNAKVAPLNSLVIDGNCRVEDKGVKAHHGHMVYVLCVYNKKVTHNRITMGALNIQESLSWKEKLELVIHRHALLSANDNKTSTPSVIGMDNDGNASSSDQESQGSPEEEDNNPTLIRETTAGNGPPDLVFDWTREPEIGLSNQTNNDEFFPRKRWRLVRCQNGLRIFEELAGVDYLPRSCTKAMKAVGVVDASCEAVFELVMSMDSTRFEWDCSFQYGSLVEEVDGHTAIVYHRLQLEWFSMFVWPRDLCYMRYWRRNDDGSYVVLFRSRVHPHCRPQKQMVRAHIESGGFKISPLKSSKGKARTQVQHLMQIDLKGWLVGYCPSFQQHCLLQMLNSVAGMREFFSQTDEIKTVKRIPVMVKVPLTSVSTKKNHKREKSETHPSLAMTRMAHSRKESMMIDYSDEDEDNQVPESEEQLHLDKTGDNIKQTEVLDEKPLGDADLACFTGILCRDDNENGRNCWRVPDGNNFKVRGENYARDKTKVPAGKYLMELVAVDWLKGTKRLDHVARRPGCAAQVAAEKGLFSLVINMQIPGSTHYSMVFYYVMEQLSHGSLLQQFVDGDDEFRNSRLKLIPSVHKGSWIVRQSVGSTPCLLGRALDCTYIRREKYLEIEVDIGSSAVANGVLGLVLGVISSLIIDIAFLVQAVTDEELPERLIGAVRVAHVELSSAISTETGFGPTT